MPAEDTLPAPFFTTICRAPAAMPEPPAGTSTLISVSLQLVTASGAAVVGSTARSPALPMSTAPEPWAPPKSRPLMVTVWTPEVTGLSTANSCGSAVGTSHFTAVIWPLKVCAAVRVGAVSVTVHRPGHAWKFVAMVRYRESYVGFRWPG